MNILDTEIRVGAAQPFTVLHASDTHLTLADERDNDRKHALAAARLQGFPAAEEVLQQLTALALEENLPVLHTGDLSDFVSAANLDRMRAFTDTVDCFMAAGNHEFSQYVGEAWEDAAYREQSLARVQAAFKNDIRFASRVLHGVNFIALDNSYYLIEPWQLARLRAEAEKGLPMVLLVHTPLYSPPGTGTAARKRSAPAGRGLPDGGAGGGDARLRRPSLPPAAGGRYHPRGAGLAVQPAVAEGGADRSPAQGFCHRADPRRAPVRRGLRNGAAHTVHLTPHRRLTRLSKNGPSP